MEDKAARAKKAQGEAKAGGGRPKNEPEPYDVPPDFEASALPAVDVTTRAAAQRTAPLAFLIRWLQLREEARARKNRGSTSDAL